MSEIQNISEASLLDNIFEGRNKSYGAYELRTNSSKRTVLALIISSIFFIATVFALYLSMKSKDKEETAITKVELKKVKTPIKKEEKKILEQKKVEPIKKVKSVVDIVKNVPPVVVNKKTVENEIPPVEPDKKSGSETAKGDANASLEKTGELAQEEQKGDEHIVGFSYMNIPRVKAEDQRSCFITYTNQTVHDLRGTGAVPAAGPALAPEAGLAVALDCKVSEACIVRGRTEGRAKRVGITPKGKRDA